MKKWIILWVMMVGLTAVGCAPTSRYNTQRGAAIGAGLGALAGQAIGHDTGSTLIGTGVGALLGTIVGNGVDQQEEEYRYARDSYRNNNNEEYQQGNNHYEGQYDGDRSYSYRQPPPGRWVTVPGHWEGRRWVPPHDEWRPVDPGYNPYR